MKTQSPSHWAKIDASNVVVSTIVADLDWINSGKSGNPDDWIEYTNGKGDGMPGPCGIGMTYSSDLGQFIPETPFASWVLNTTTMQWEAPVALPQEVFVVLGGPIGIQTTRKHYVWNESSTSWDVADTFMVPTGDNDDTSDNYIAPTRTQAEAEADGG